jgi:glycosyltransferase involved in cell wall biosynthesis
MSALVTICLPVFNSSQHLRDAVQSVISQSYANIQVVAIDDASIDNSYEILKEYESDHFLVYRNPINLGMESNWNKCLEYAKGKYIKMMGADDLLSPDCISKQVHIIETIKVDIVSSNRFIVSGDGRPVLKLKSPLSGYIEPQKALRRLVGAGRNIIGEPVACLIRKEALDKVGGFSSINRYVIDIETWSKLMKINGLFAMQDYLSYFRISKGSVSSGEGINQIRSVFQFISLYRGRDIGYFNKLKGYFLAILFGLARNLLFKFCNRSI